MIGAVILVAGALALLADRLRKGGEPFAPDRLPRPGERWVAAMRAEHAAIVDPVERRRFARGCLRALLVGRVPVDDIAARVRWLVLAAIAGAAGVAVFGLVAYPGLREGAWIAYVAMFAGALGVHALLGRRLALYGSSQARVIGVAAGFPAVALAAAAARGSGSWSGALALTTAALPALAAWLATRHDRDLGSAIVATGTAAVIAGVLAFIGYATVTYATNGGTPTPRLLAEFHQSGLNNYTTWAVGDNLGGAVFMLGFVLTVGSALGVLVSIARAPSVHR